MKRRSLIVSFAAASLITSACGGSGNAAEIADEAAAAATTSTAPVASEASTDEASTDEASTDEASADEASADEGTTDEGTTDDASTFFPNVLDANATQDEDGSWTFSVTLSSPYDTPEQYADAWRVVDPDGTELGFRLLTHDHASEQPFTRSHSGVEIPDGVTTVTIEGRDQANGWGGSFFELDLPA